jgi:adenylosuccinate synthase
VDVKSKIDAVTVFPDAAMVTRVGAVEAPAGVSTLVFRDLPMNVDPASLRVTGEAGAKLAIGAVEARIVPGEGRQADSAVEMRLKQLRAEREGWQVTIDASSTKLTMIGNYSKIEPQKLAGEDKVVDIAQWSSAFDMIGAAAARTGDELRSAKARARDLDDEIKALAAGVAGPAPGAKARSDAQRHRRDRDGAGAPGEIHAGLSRRRRRLERGLRRPSRQPEAGAGMGAPRRRQPAHRRGLERRRAGGLHRADRAAARRPPTSRRRSSSSSRSANRSSIAAATRRRPCAPNVGSRRCGQGGWRAAGSAVLAAPSPMVQAEETQASVEAGAFQATFRIPGRVSLAADGSVKTLRVAGANVTPTLSARTSPSLEEAAYLSARFTLDDEAPVLAGRVNLFRDGVFAGTAPVKLTAPGEPMANVVVVGAQWGDEGKGKIVDWLSIEADVVVRFQGGHNAGHTLVIDGVTYKLSLLPSGIVRPGKLSVIGNGVVVDPHHLVAEIAKLRGQGVAISRDNLRIAENAPLILSLHRELDGLRETPPAPAPRSAPPSAASARPTRTRSAAAPSASWISPTRRRSTPRSSACSRTTTRCAAASVSPKFRRRHPRRAEAGAPTPSCPMWTASGRCWRPAPRRQAHPVRGRAGRAARHRSRHLSLRHLVQHRRRPGRDRLGPRAEGDRLRARHRQGLYDARRRGAVPHRAHDETGRLIGERGREFGTVTGRARRCGWFDAVLVRQTVKTSGIDGIALTKLDILDGFKEIKVCVGYELDGERSTICRRARRRRRASSRSTRRSRAGRHDRRRALLGATAGAGDQICAARRGTDRRAGALLSTSPERGDTILVHNPFQD